MTERDAFLTAIYAAPEEDVPRLVYSDWLEEQGQVELAEFIRLQCRMARNEPLSMVEEDRVYDLAEIHRHTWTSHLPQEKVAVWRFRRGLPEELEIYLSAFLQDYERWSTLPRVRCLSLMDTTGFLLQAFADRTWNLKWVGLQLAEDPRPWLHPQPHDPSPGVAAVVLSPQASRLRELCFAYHDLGEGGIRALCESPYLEQLALLEVDGASCTNARLVERFGAKLCRWGDRNGGT